MPPPLEEEEDFEERAAYASDSDGMLDRDASKMPESPKAASSQHQLLGAKDDVKHEPPQKVRDVSPVPLVVSDIVRRAAPAQRTALPSSKPPDSKEKTQARDNKRARDSDKLDQGPLVKKKKGNRREIPCVYCVRRLANDPKWACHDALLNQYGGRNYKGARCDGCVGAHVSCQLIPDKAAESVRTLVKTAADVAASNGTNKIQLLAAYEAAIGPALKDIIVVPDAKATESQKRKQKSPASKPQPSSTRHRLPNGPKSSRSLSSGGAGAKQPPPPQPPLQQQQQQHLQPDPTTFFSSPTPQNHQQQLQRQQSDAADLERLERQALRRRKVEALESLSHTAALFLAEFMTFTKRQNASSTSSSGAGANGKQGSGGDGDGGGLAPVPNHGMEYAAAAAGMAASLFPHLTSQNKDTQSYSNHTSMASRLDATTNNDGDDDDDDNEEEEQDDDDGDDDDDSDNDSPQASSLARNGREPSSTARIPSEQDENDVEMNSASDPDEDNGGGNDGDGSGRGKQEALNDERSTSQQSEVKVEKQ